MARDISGEATEPSLPSPRHLAPGTRLGRYLVRNEVGRGGMAIVYRAEDTTLRREVAIKVLIPHLVRQKELTGRFLREARAAAALDHPGILKIFDVGGGDDQDDPPYIVMELIRGRSLKEFLEKNGAPLAEVAAMIGVALAEALAAAHSAGVIHRDVKPANVMITDEGRLVLCDFGVARLANDDAVATQSGMILGTPVFMSPEQAHGRNVDVRSDVYSLGATIYQLSTGCLPFVGTTAAVISAVTRGELVPPARRNPAIGGSMARLIQKSMAVEPAERQQSASELAEVLIALARVPGLGERADELKSYFADPAAWNARARPRIIAAALDRAEKALGRREVAKALAECDRVMALEPGNVAAGKLLDGVARGQKLRKGGIVAGSVVLAAAVVAGGLQLFDKDPRPVVVVDVDGGTSEALDAEVVAVVVDAGEDHKVVIVPAPAADAGPRRTGPRAKAVMPPDAAPVVAEPVVPVEPARPEPPATGKLLVKIGPTCQVTIDGQRAGASPMTQPVELPVGQHKVVCENPITGQRMEKQVEIFAGRTETVRDVLAVRVVVSIGTTNEIRVDGVAHKRGAKVELTAGSHRVERLEGGRVVDTRYVQIPTVPCTLRDLPELNCQ